MSTRLFVGNVPDSINENDLKNAFSQYGQIINVDLKNKPGAENDQKKFAFVTLSASIHEVESCIRYFSNEDFGGYKLYVTRARESFLERLQRERQESQKKDLEKDQHKDVPKTNPVLKLGDKLNPRKRKIDSSNDNNNKTLKEVTPNETRNYSFKNANKVENQQPNKSEKDKKQQDSDKKRMESIKNKRQEFKKKQMIIKTGLLGIDKVQNKKVIFSDNDEDVNVRYETSHITISKFDKGNNNKNSLFEDDDESDNDVNFDIKEQFEGKKGQKVLDLQSRYKSDKRFVLDERFMEDGHSEEERHETNSNEDKIDLGDADEKRKQLNILQDVLGISIKSKTTKFENQNTKSKFGMLRFDPLQPEHAKFLARAEESKQEPTKKSKASKIKETLVKQKVGNEENEKEKSKVTVSKEQFYKVSDTLKEALVQPATFSLRSLFGQNDTKEKGDQEQNAQCMPLEKLNKPKVKHPLDLVAKNPFVYDSSDSETEEADNEPKIEPPNEIEPKAVWKENLFFSKLDSRLKDGLEFFNRTAENEVQKERRELKSVMKKRTYNKERKNQMFQKKIGGRKKSMKKSYRKKT